MGQLDANGELIADCTLNTTRSIISRSLKKRVILLAGKPLSVNGSWGDSSFPSGQRMSCLVLFDLKTDMSKFSPSKNSTDSGCDLTMMLSMEKMAWVPGVRSRTTSFLILRLPLHPSRPGLLYDIPSILWNGKKISRKRTEDEIYGSIKWQDDHQQRVTCCRPPVLTDKTTLSTSHTSTHCLMHWRYDVPWKNIKNCQNGQSARTFELFEQILAEM